MGYPAAMLEDAERNGFGSLTELPVTYVIDRDGIVRDRLHARPGRVHGRIVGNAVVPLLQQKPTAITTAAGTGTPSTIQTQGFLETLFREFSR